MKFKLLSVLLLLSLASFSQGEASNWFFGNKAGIKFNPDNSITVLSVSPNPIGINTNEGCSAISDPAGNLILYTDGRTVWDRNHIIMPNGNYEAGTGLHGDPSSTQSGVIIPNPNNPNIYYIFTVDEPHHTNASVYPNQFTGNYPDAFGTVPQDDDGFNNGLNYSVVDLSANGINGSVGDVVSRNNHLVTYDPNPAGEEIKYKCSEKITAVRAQLGLGYWVITQFTNKFYVFKIDEDGVNAVPVVTPIAPLVPTSGYRRNAIGQLKASPNGKKIAIAHNQTGTITGGTAFNGAVYLYDFDNATGAVSNPVLLLENANPYGIEFSAETKKLYVSTNSGIFQFNLESASIPDSKVFISNSDSASLQLGPDKKIYKANVFFNTALDVINSPELDGLACNYESGAVDLGVGTSRFGLPHFITSIFNSNIRAKNLCLGDNTEFEASANGIIASASWNFGDGSTPSSSVSPTHVYASAGNYTVSVTLVVEGITVSNSKTITIAQLPDAFPATITQCSATAATASIPFNLSQATETLTGGNPNVIASFFKLQSDAASGINQLPLNYSNISNPEQLVAKVTNPVTGCYALTTLDLIVNPFNGSETILRKCDDAVEDGKTGFLLTDASIPVLPATATVAYYATSNDALLEQNSLNPSFTNTIANEQTLYARAEENGSCLGIYPIKLIVDALPQIEVQDTDYVCTNIAGWLATLTPGLPAGSISGYTFIWSTGETAPTIQAGEPGTYTVKVTNASGCYKIRTINVLPSNSAAIQSVAIVDLA
ncbi:MAG TPA: PKD domain-containing protein, partial [Flavobacterium sp.]|nr:PKD domain-containing protein [Flavobacterium sp.]